MSKIGVLLLALIFGGTVAMAIFIALTILSEMAPIR